jgi:hypothetical protein
MKKLALLKALLTAQLVVAPLVCFGVETNNAAKQHQIENPRCSWKLDMQINHPNGVYKVGEDLEITVEVPRDCYVHIININPNGEFSVLWPLKEGESSFVKEKQKISLPATDHQPKIQFQATQPVGKELIVCFATTRPLNLKQEKDKKMFLDFLVGVEKVLPTTITKIKSFVTMVQQDDAGWTANAVEVTTVD